MAVLVTGATGFIARYVIEYLLRENYDVIGTVRSQDKADRLHEQFGKNQKLSLEIVTDITDIKSFDPLFSKRGKQINVVLHLAFPLHVCSSDYENNLLVPSVNSVKGILTSIMKYAADSVERVVYTSSFLAIFDAAKANDKTAVFTEKDWNPVVWEDCNLNIKTAFAACQKFAEQTAWKFLDENRAHVKFQLTSITPTCVFGPQLFEEDAGVTLNPSNRFISRMVHSTPELGLEPNCHLEFVDVRDVAKAHLLAFQQENTAGERLGLSNSKFDNQCILDILNSKFPRLRGKISKGPNPGKGDLHPGCTFDNSRSRKILGFELIDLEKSVYDTAFQILKKESRL